MTETLSLLLVHLDVKPVLTHIFHFTREVLNASPVLTVEMLSMASATSTSPVCNTLCLPNQMEPVPIAMAVRLVLETRVLVCPATKIRSLTLMPTLVSPI